MAALGAAKLDKDQARVRRIRGAGLALGALSAILLGIGKLLADKGQTQLALAVLLGAIVALAASLGLRAWGSREARRLAARQPAGPQGAARRVETASGIPELDTRFTDPGTRKGYGRRKWVFFALAFLFLALAEFQYSERGNTLQAILYAAFGLVSLGYALVLQQRLRAAA